MIPIQNKERIIPTRLLKIYEYNFKLTIRILRLIVSLELL